MYFVEMWMHHNIEVLYMEFLSSIVFHTDLFIPCNIYVFGQNVDAPTTLYIEVLYMEYSIIDSIPHCPIYPL